MSRLNKTYTKIKLVAENNRSKEGKNKNKRKFEGREEIPRERAMRNTVRNRLNDRTYLYIYPFNYLKKKRLETPYLMWAMSTFLN